MSVANLRIQQKLQKIKQDFEVQKAAINRIDFEYTSPVKAKQPLLLHNPSTRINTTHNPSQLQKFNNEEVYISNEESMVQMPQLLQGVDRLFSYNQFKLNESKTITNALRFRTPLKLRSGDNQEILSTNLQEYGANSKTSRNRPINKRSYSMTLNQNQPQSSRLLELSMKKSNSRVMKILNQSALDTMDERTKPQTNESSSQVYRIIEPVSRMSPINKIYSTMSAVEDGVLTHDFSKLPQIQNKKSCKSLQPKSLRKYNKLSSFDQQSNDREGSVRSQSRIGDETQEQIDRRLTRDISKEKDCFKRQKMLFDLVDNNKERTVDISGIFNQKHIQSRNKSQKPGNYTILKTEKSTSSIVQQIKPQFPLNAGFDINELVHFDKEEERVLKVQDILNGVNPIKKYQSEQKSQIKLELDQAIYRNKITNLNMEVVDKHIDLSNKFLSDEFMYKLLQSKNNLKSTKSIKLNCTKQIKLFDIHGWEKLEGVCDHRGNQISKQGYQMGELEAQKEQEKLIKQKFEQQQVLQKSMHKSSKSKSKTGSENFFSHNKRSSKNLNVDLKRDIDTDFVASRAETPMHGAQSSHQQNDELNKKTITFEQYQDNRDQELKEIAIKKQKAKLSSVKKQQSSYMTRQQTISLKKQTKEKAQQQRLLEIKQEMEQEEEDYWNEWRDNRQEEMLSQVDRFLKQKKSQIIKVNEEILEMENNSEDELDMFDNFVSTKANNAMKVNRDFKEKAQNKKQKVNQLLITQNNQDKNQDAQDQQVGHTQFNEAKKNSGFQKALNAAQQKIEFAELIQEVYSKGENMNYDQPKPDVNQNQEEESDRYSDEEPQVETEEEKNLRLREQEEQKDVMSKKYIQNCREEKVLPLPTVHKIIDGVLTLDEYKLNTGQCKALGSVLEDLGTDIYKIVLKNNGIDDNAYAYIIEGAVKNPNITSLVNVGNQFKEQSLNQLIKYFDRSRRAVLSELVISGCKTSLTLMNRLLKELSEYSNLTALGISQSKLDKDSVEYLADIINGNIKLRELDLSWNEITCLNMGTLLQNIEYCRHISYLNLSYNSIVGKPEDSQIVIDSLCNFTRRNKSLMHLDLSYCGLKKDQLFQVIVACKKSRSLLAVHMTGNLITEETKIKIRSFMRPRKRVKNLYDKINAPDSDDESTAQANKIELSVAIQQKLAKYDVAEATGQAKEQQGTKKGNPGERLIFTRILGHFEIPRSHKWIESTECWICEKHQYTVFCMSKQIAKKMFIEPRLKDKENYVAKIQHSKHKQDDTLTQNNDDQWGSDNDEIYYDADNEDQKYQNHFNNQIAGTFSQWKCRSFMPLSQFIKRIQKNRQQTARQIKIEKTDYEKQLVQDKVDKEQRLLVIQARQSLQKGNIEQIKIDYDDNNQWEDKISELDQQIIPSINWLGELESIKENTNFVVSLDQLHQYRSGVSKLKEKMYVYAAYMAPGKHNTCVLYNTQNQPKKNIYNLIIYVKPRQLPLELKQKRIKEFAISRKFFKPTSMFKDWTDDSAKNLKTALQKDLDYSKCNRFIKDYFDFTRLKDVLFKHSAIIKDIFTYAIAISSFPSISWIDFTLLCNQWQIPDKGTCTMQTIDRIFIAVNVEIGEEHEDNPDRDLCRYEFYEIIVRMGGAKYRDSGQCDTWDKATSMLIEKCLIPNTLMMGGQSFRDKYIWTLPIDDLMRANYEFIQKLYMKYTTAGKRYLDLEICKQLVQPLEINDQDVIQAYAFSKITIIDEMETKDKYVKLLLVEFMDFLCRCAYIKYQQVHGISFLEKCERVLDILFKGVGGMKRKKPDFEIEVSSQSDYSSDD